MRREMHTYKVYYSGRSSAKVKASSVAIARRKAWAMLNGFKYGWSKSDFLRNASVTKVR